MAMKRWWAIFLLLPCVLPGQEMPATSAALPSITVSLPDSVKPESTSIHYSFRSAAGASTGGVLQTRAGVRDYPVLSRLSGVGSPDSLKLLVYIPGYRMVKAEFSRPELQAGRIFIPTLIPLPTTTITGRLVDSAGNALKNEQLSLEYSMTEQMGYFGYADGMVPSIPIADVSTDENGDFSIALSSLLDDPFFEDTSSPGMYRLHVGKDFRNPDATVIPDSFHLQKTYELLTIRKVRNGTLKGRLDREFFRGNNLSGAEGFRIEARPPAAPVRQIPSITADELRRPPRRAPAAAEPSMSSFSNLVKADGTFELRVPPGTYDVHVWAFGKDLRMSDDDRRISLGQNIVIEEGKQRVLD